MVCFPDGGLGSGVDFDSIVIFWTWECLEIIFWVWVSLEIIHC